MATTKNKPLTKKQTQKIIDSNQKSIEQEVTEIVRYPGLKFVSRFCKIFGIVIAVVFFVVAIIMLFVQEGWDKLFYFLGAIGLGIIYTIVGFFLGDFCQILVDMEENTRKRIK